MSLVVDGPHAIGAALTGLDLRSISAILYIAFLSTLGGFAAWSWLMRTYPAGQVASFALLVPPFGLGFGALLLGEHIGVAQLLGAALVVCGVALSTRAPGRGQAPQRNGDSVTGPAPATKWRLCDERAEAR